MERRQAQRASAAALLLAWLAAGASASAAAAAAADNGAAAAAPHGAAAAAHGAAAAQTCPFVHFACNATCMEATTSALVQLLAHLADGPVTRAQLVGRRCEGGMPAYCCWRPALVDCCCSDCSYACQRCRVAGAVRRLGLAGQLAPGTSMQQLEAPLAVLGRYGLQVLNLLGNELHGSLPAALPAILPEVQVLDVGDNVLTGTIPANLGQLMHLSNLCLDSNRLTGTIPPLLCGGAVRSASQALDALDAHLAREQRAMLNSSPAAVAARAAALSEIDFNPGGLAAVFGSVLTQLQARSNSLEGSVALGNCTNLVLLDLRDNALTGTLPSSADWHQITAIRVNNNQFSTLPPDFFKMRTLFYIDATNNSLSGSLPADFKHMYSLTNIYFGSNFLTGTIPPELFSQARLSYLLLDHNTKLAGTLPDAINRLTGLNILDVSSTNVHGPLPSGLGSMHTLTMVNVLGSSMYGCPPGHGANGSGQGGCDGPGSCLPPYLAVLPDETYSPFTPAGQSIALGAGTAPISKSRDNEQALLVNPHMACPTLVPNASYPGYHGMNHDQIWLVPPEYTGFCGCVCDQGYMPVWGDDATVSRRPRLTCVQEERQAQSAVLAVAIAMALLAVLLGAALVLVMLVSPGWLTGVMRSALLVRKRLRGAPAVGKVSLVVTDIEQYTALMKAHPAAASVALEQHFEVLRHARWEHAGHVVEQEGDSYVLAFHDAVDAVGFCLQAQQALMLVDWPAEVLQPPQQPQSSTPRPYRPSAGGGTPGEGTSTSSSRPGYKAALTKSVSMPLGDLDCQPGQAPDGDAVGNTSGPVSPSDDATPPIDAATKFCSAANLDAAGRPPAPSPTDLLFRGLRVRMGVATGFLDGQLMKHSNLWEVAKTIGDAGNGGQVLIDEATFEGIREWLAELGAIGPAGFSPPAMRGKTLLGLCGDTPLADAESSPASGSGVSGPPAAAASGGSSSLRSRLQAVWELLSRSQDRRWLLQHQHRREALVLHLGRYSTLAAMQAAGAAPQQAWQAALLAPAGAAGGARAPRGAPAAAGAVGFGPLYRSGSSRSPLASGSPRASLGGGPAASGSSSSRAFRGFGGFEPGGDGAAAGGRRGSVGEASGAPSPRGSITDASGGWGGRRNGLSMTALSASGGGFFGRRRRRVLADVQRLLAAGHEDGQADIVLYQVLAPSLAARAKIFGNRLVLGEGACTIEAPYFDAPGAWEAPLVAHQVHNLRDSSSCTGRDGSSHTSRTAPGPGALQPAPTPATPGPASSMDVQLALLDAAAVVSAGEGQPASAAASSGDAGAGEQAAAERASGRGRAAGEQVLRSRLLLPAVTVVFVAVERRRQLQMLHPGRTQQMLQLLGEAMREILRGLHIHQQALDAACSPHWQPSSSYSMGRRSGGGSGGGNRSSSGSSVSCSSSRYGGVLARELLGDGKFMLVFHSPAAAVEFCCVLQEAALYLPYPPELLAGGGGRTTAATRALRLLGSSADRPPVAASTGGGGDSGGFMRSAGSGSGWAPPPLGDAASAAAAGAASGGGGGATDASASGAGGAGGPFEEVVDSQGRLVFRGPRLRMGICEGVPRAIQPDYAGRADYFGDVVNQAARFMDAAAHGGQIAMPHALLLRVCDIWHRQAGPAAALAAAGSAAVAAAAAAAAAGSGGAALPPPSSSGGGLASGLPALAQQQQQLPVQRVRSVPEGGALAASEVSASSTFGCAAQRPVSPVAQESPVGGAGRSLSATASMELLPEPSIPEAGQPGPSPPQQQQQQQPVQLEQSQQQEQAAAAAAMTRDTKQQQGGRWWLLQGGGAASAATPPPAGQTDSPCSFTAWQAGAAVPPPAASAAAALHGSSAGSGGGDGRQGVPLTPLQASVSTIREGVEWVEVLPAAVLDGIGRRRTSLEHGACGAGGAAALAAVAPAGSSAAAPVTDGVPLLAVAAAAGAAPRGGGSGSSTRFCAAPMAPLDCSVKLTRLHVFNLGLFRFKGSSQPVRMVHVCPSRLATRRFPAAPPKGKGTRLAPPPPDATAPAQAAAASPFAAAAALPLWGSPGGLVARLGSAGRVGRTGSATSAGSGASVGDGQPAGERAVPAGAYDVMHHLAHVDVQLLDAAAVWRRRSGAAAGAADAGSGEQAA